MRALRRPLDRLPLAHFSWEAQRPHFSRIREWPSQLSCLVLDCEPRTLQHDRSARRCAAFDEFAKKLELFDSPAVSRDAGHGGISPDLERFCCNRHALLRCRLAPVCRLVCPADDKGLLRHQQAGALPSPTQKLRCICGAKNSVDLTNAIVGTRFLQHQELGAPNGALASLLHPFATTVPTSGGSFVVAA